MFALHPQLQADTLALGRFELCELLLMNDAHFPWFILVPRRLGLREIYELTVADRYLLMDESARFAQVLAARFEADKINIAALGNVVPQLHIHHIVRYRHDPAWPAPVWGRLPARPYLAAEIEAIRNRLADLINA